MNKKLFSIILAFSVILIFACSGNEKKQTEMPDQNNKVEDVQSELVRMGEIDLNSIDKNKDGKVNECPMDWNVISDDAGDCPVCGMNLKEFSIADVKVNLEKYGYNYVK